MQNCRITIFWDGIEIYSQTKQSKSTKGSRPDMYQKREDNNNSNNKNMSYDEDIFLSSLLNKDKEEEERKLVQEMTIVG